MKIRITSILFLVLSLCSCIKETIHVNGISLDASALTIAIGDKDKLVATISPSDANNQVVVWSSSDASVVRVNTDGEISAIAPGKADITAKSDDGGYTAKCVVTVPEVYVPVKSITLNTEQLSLNKGESATVKATVVPENASNSALRWMSTDESIATVNNDGKVNALAPGHVTIIATAEADGRISASCALTVEQHVGEIVLSKSTLALKELQQETLEYEIKPEDAVDKSVTWKSSNEEVAKVTDGTVYALKAGEATITATTNDGGKTAECKLTVTCDVAGVSLNEHELSLIVDETRTLVATVYPGNASNQKLSWTSSKSAVAVVDETGKITAVAPGQTVITVRTEDQGKEDSCTVTVDYEVQGVTLSEHNVTVSTGKTVKLTASVNPADAKNKGLEWTSSAPNVASVSAEGVVKGLVPGTAKISVKTAEGGYTDECAVTVEYEVKGVTLSEHNVTVSTGKTLQLSASVYPADAANQGLVWSSSAKDVAEVSAEGLVSAKKPGTAKIMVKTAEGACTDECVVTVEYEVKGVTLSEHNVTVSAGKTIQLSASVTPADAKNQNLVWTSSLTKIATVSSDGVVTGVAPGTAKIMVKTAEGGYTDECVVTVDYEVKGVTLSEHNVAVSTGNTLQLTATIYPANSSNKELVWSSSAKDIAEVSADGLVTAKKPGIAKITVKTAEGNNSDECIVTVEYEVKGVTLSEHNITLATGHTFTLEASVYPVDAANKELVWSSSSKEIAEVSASGVVKAKAPGEAKITVKTAEGGFTDICSVRVEYEVKSVSLKEHNITLDTGKSFKLVATVEPSTASNKALTWSSDRSDIASVSNDGTVTAKAPGKAEIMVTTADGGFKDVCSVTVEYEVKSVSLSEHNITLDTKKTFKLNATVSPSTASNKAVSWVSSDTEVAAVSSDGTVTAKAPGKAVITVTTAEGGLTDSCNVQVQYEVKSVYLSDHDITVSTGTEKTLVATVLPSSALNQKVSWQSDRPDVATVSDKGLMTAIAPGAAVITVTTDEGGFTDQCTVHVQLEVTGITLSEHNISLDAGKSVKLDALVLPAAASNKNVSWISSDESVAKVASDGTVTAIAPGTAVITVSTDEGGFTDKCTVTVQYEVRSVSLSEHNITLDTKNKKSFKLVANVQPSSASNKSVSWSSSDSDVADVSADGTVSAKKPGTAVITVTTLVGGLTDECNVKVESVVADISFKGVSELNLVVGDIKSLEYEITPPEASNKKVNWTSSNKSVATVDENGVITAKAVGTTTVCATTEDSGKHALCTVNVRERISKVNVTPATLDLNIGEAPGQLSYEILPSKLAYLGVTWLVDEADADVVSVSSDGKVTPKKIGTARVIASTVDGVSGFCEVTVHQPVTSITVTPANLVLWEGESEKLSVKVAPDDADIKDYDYKVTVGNSPVNGYLSFDKESGTVTALRGGEVLKLSFIPKNALSTVAPAVCSIEVWAHVKSVELNVPGLNDDGQKELSVGTEFQLNAVVSPSKAHNPKLNWSSSAPDVVSVDANGKISVKAKGLATITAVSEDNPDAKASIVIKGDNIHVSSISIKEAENGDISIKVGEKITLTPIVKPDNAFDRTVRWESKQPTIASVDENTGVVTGESAGGPVTIRAISNDNESIYKDCRVVVIPTTYAVEGVSLSSTVITDMNVGEERYLIPTIQPSNATNKNLTWTSSDPRIVSVDKYGKIEAVSAGTATITVRTEDGGFTASCVVTVLPPPVQVSEISLSETYLFLTYGGSARLTATVLPADAANKNVIWTSANPTIATVENGMVRAGSTTGTTTITATSESNSAIIATCTVEVVAAVVELTKVTLDASILSLYVNQTHQFTAKLTPANASVKSITWSASQGGGVYVSSDGVVSGSFAGGSAMVTVSVVDMKGNTKQATCAVSIKKNEVGSVVLDRDDICLKVGETFDLTSTLVAKDPSFYATNSAVNWTSSSGAIATVSQVGKDAILTTEENTMKVNSVGRVVAVGAGEATITVTSKDNGGKTMNCHVLVLAEGSSPGGNEGVGFDDWNF